MKNEKLQSLVQIHFSKYGSGKQFRDWAFKNFGQTILPNQITRAKEGQFSTFSAIVFQVYLQRVEEFNN